MRTPSNLLHSFITQQSGSMLWEGGQVYRVNGVLSRITEGRRREAGSFENGLLLFPELGERIEAQTLEILISEIVQVGAVEFSRQHRITDAFRTRATTPSIRSLNNNIVEFPLTAPMAVRSEIMTTDEVSQELLICNQAVRKMINRGKLKAGRSQSPPWRWEISKESVTAFKATHRFHRGPRGGVRWVEKSSN